MTPNLPQGASRRELRKAVLRMRLEMHRQELRHEMLQIGHPLKQVREYGRRLRRGNAPFPVSYTHLDVYKRQAGT